METQYNREGLILIRSTFLSLVCGLVFWNCAKEKRSDNPGIDPIVSFEREAVQLLDGPFREARDLAARNLLDYYEPDRFLSRLRPLAGLEPKAPAYEGWTTWATGHTLGHYMSGCAMAYASLQEDEYEERVAYMVEELALIQRVSGSGYISKPEQRLVFENEIARGQISPEGFLLNGMEVPLYIMHKILAGLRDAYRYTGNKKALDVEIRFADWIYDQLMHLEKQDFRKVLTCEYGGIAETLADLSADSGDEKYLNLAARFYESELMDPIVAGTDNLAGLHANTQIPKYIGMARIYELTGDTRAQAAAANFWKLVVEDHSYVTGGNSYHEHFSYPGKLNDYLDNKTTESCNTYNMLKLSNHLHQWAPDRATADFMERSIINHSLASQHPESGNVMYYLPLGMPSYRNFEDPYVFSCCVGSGMEHHFLYSQFIYAHNQAQLYVNQFIPSQLTWKAKEVVITQRSSFPDSGDAVLEIQTKAPVYLDIRIRKPGWLEEDMAIRINGEVTEAVLLENGYYTLSRAWDSGDEITLSFPFSLRQESMPDNPSRIALFNGPVLLAGDLGSDKSRAASAEFVPVLLTEGKPLESWIEKGTGSNTFMTAGSGEPRDVQLLPFYKAHDRYHTAYWDTFSPAEWQKSKDFYLARKQGFSDLEKRTVDSFQPGEMQSERDHDFGGRNMEVVEYEGIKGRRARDGSFSFSMKVLPESPMALVQKYWGNVNGNEKASFDIFVEDEFLANRILHWNGGFFELTDTIPERLTRGKNQVRISFKTKPGFQAGPLCGIRMIRREMPEK